MLPSDVSPPYIRGPNAICHAKTVCIWRLFVIITEVGILKMAAVAATYAWHVGLVIQIKRVVGLYVYVRVRHRQSANLCRDAACIAQRSSTDHSFSRVLEDEATRCSLPRMTRLCGGLGRVRGYSHGLCTQQHWES